MTYAKMSVPKAFNDTESKPAGGVSFKTVIVRTIANTPSLKASRRPFDIEAVNYSSVGSSSSASISESKHCVMLLMPQRRC